VVDDGGVPIGAHELSGGPADARRPRQRMPPTVAHATSTPRRRTPDALGSSAAPRRCAARTAATQSRAQRDRQHADLHSPPSTRTATPAVKPAPMFSAQRRVRARRGDEHALQPFPLLAVAAFVLTHHPYRLRPGDGDDRAVGRYRAVRAMARPARRESSRRKLAAATGHRAERQLPDRLQSLGVRRLRRDARI